VTDKISILITRREDASDPSMPSQFWPGAGSEGAKFRVLGPVMPSELDLSAALSAWRDWSSLVSYDAESGVGYFQVIDDDAPPAGVIVELEAQDTTQIRRVTIIIERCGNDH
jgi:hypothetical protein